MKIYVNALQLDSPANVPLEGFLGYLQRETFLEFEHSNRKRILAFANTGGFVAGILLSDRDHRNFIVVERNENNIPTIQVQQSGQPMADFNAFVINQRSGTGLLTSYHGSGGMLVWGNILKSHYRAHVKALRDQAVTEASELEPDLSQKGLAKIRSQFRKSQLNVTPVMHDANFAAELAKLMKVTKFEFIEPRVHESRFSSIRKLVQKQKQSWSFKPDRKITQQLHRILPKFVSETGITQGKVSGKVGTGGEEHVSINPEIYCMKKLDYDDVVRSDNIRLDSVADTPLARKLVGMMKSRPELFGT